VHARLKFDDGRGAEQFGRVLQVSDGRDTAAHAAQADYPEPFPDQKKQLFGVRRNREIF
jgi:hypothetical protein